MAISTIWALTNGAGDNTEAQLASTTHVIRPNTALFFSLAWPSEALDDANPVAMQEDSEQLEALKDQNVELKSYAEITVSIDGAFFDDGAFVGTDTTGYFAEIKAQVDAAYDVLREFQLGKQSGKAADEISRRLDEAANGPNIRLGSSSTPEDHYLHDKKRIAQELSNIWKYKGDDKALKYVSMRLGKPWPTLRKL